MSVYIRQSKAQRPCGAFKAASLTQANPVQNTWYTVAELRNVKFRNAINYSVATANETLEVKITVGSALLTATSSKAATAGSGYMAQMMPSQAAAGFWLYEESTVHPQILYETDYLKVEIRKTTATGTGTISAAINYMQME